MAYYTYDQPLAAKWASFAAGRPSKQFFLKGTGKGCDRLQQMALRACVWNIESFLPETLEPAGWFYAQKIWAECKEKKAVSFNAWNLFMQAFPEELDEFQQFTLKVSERKKVAEEDTLSEFPHIVNRFSRLDTNALTHLVLNGFSFRTEHLISLTSIASLCALSITYEHDTPYVYCQFSSAAKKMLKHWGRAVHESGAFKQLKVLVLQNFHVSLEDTVEGIATFPVLSLLGVKEYLNPRGVPELFRAPTVSKGSAHWLRYSSRHSRDIIPRCGMFDSSKANRAVGEVSENDDQEVVEDLRGMDETTSVEIRRLGHPTDIWASRETRSLEKLHMVYQISQRFQKTQANCAGSKAVGMYYTTETYSSPPGDTTWYYPAPEGYVVEPPCSWTRKDKEVEPPAKKRKIRREKQQDVSALLGSMT